MKKEHLKRQIEGTTMQRGSVAPLELAALIREAKHAQARNQRVIDDENVLIDSRRSSIPGYNGAISLRAYLPELLDSEARVYRAPAPSAPAGETHRLDMTLIQNSRVMQAGSRLIVMPEAMIPVSDLDNKQVGFRNEPVRMVNINAASVDALTLDVNDEATVTAQALPIAEAAIIDENWTQRAVRFELPRSVMRNKGISQLTTEIMTSIALGIGRAADQELLTAINATTPTGYAASAVIATAAAAGLRFDELRAIIGTAGTGAAVDAGRLYVGGVPGELTPDMAATLMGAWDRAAVAVSSEITLLVERTSADGSMAVTAWVDMQALIPEPGKFWAVI